MRLLPSSLLLLSLLPACPGDDPPDPVVLNIDGERAALLAARQGDGAWQALTANASGKASLEVDGPFDLVGACEDFGGEIYAYSGGPADGVDAEPHKFDIGCGVAADADVTFTTTSAAPLTVFVDYFALDVSSGIDDVATIRAGRHDIAILDEATGMLAIRRNVELQAGSVVSVDLSGAAAIVSRDVTSVPAGAGVTSWTYTANGTRIRYASLDTAGWSMPASLAAADDKHYVAAREYDAVESRSRFRSMRVEAGATAPLSVTLPPHITSATLTWSPAPSATFQAPGDWEEVSLFGYQTDDDLAPLWFVMQYPDADRTVGQLAAPAGVTGIAGWKPAWNPSAGAFYMAVDVGRETADGAEGASWWVDAEAQKSGRATQAAAARDAQVRPTAKARRLAEMRP